jgi:hypothetical protein
MNPGPLTRCALATVAVLMAAGCTTEAAVAPTTTPPTPVVASDGADHPQVMRYADAPGAVRALLDHTGLEPVVESTGAKLAVGEHVVVAGDIDSTDLQQLALGGDVTVDAVDRIDGHGFGGRVLILAPATESDYRAWGGAKYPHLPGFTRVTPLHGGSTWITLNLAQRGPAGLSLQDDRGLLRHTIAHELFHALTLEPGFKAPLWLLEGFAEVAGSQFAALGPRHLPRTVSLPKDTQVNRRPALGYYLAWQFAAFLNHHVGQARAMRFYLAAVAPHRHGTMNALSRRYLGTPLPGLVRSWEKAYRAHGPLLG